ncbi:MAG TPA: hypothetical protein PK185_11980 [Cyclobacteriaceae bacterium]|nr:hypothetical protein [Cyclobacteriaceae bacterium]
MQKIIVIVFFSLLCFDGAAQKNVIRVNASDLTGIALPTEATMDNRIFSRAAAKTTLEVNATPHQITIDDVEVFSYKNDSGKKNDSENWLEQVKKLLQVSGYTLYPDDNDPSFTWVSRSEKYFLIYADAGKKKASLYIGVVDLIPSIQSSAIQLVLNESKTVPLPDSTTLPKTTSSTEKNNSALIGNWGTLTGPKVNWQDGSTGVMVVSGVSKGFGIELKEDGAFLIVTVVTSGRPNYRVFSSTSGTWTSTSNQINFVPTDRHYRKWENEIIMTDEHTVPDPFIMYWRKGMNAYTNKTCLYVRYADETEDRELCAE